MKNGDNEYRVFLTNVKNAVREMGKNDTADITIPDGLSFGKLRYPLECSFKA
jgi:hypothetical protein